MYLLIVIKTREFRYSGQHTNVMSDYPVSETGWNHRDDRYKKVTLETTTLMHDPKSNFLNIGMYNFDNIFFHDEKT